MELKTKRRGGAHLMALIIHHPIVSPPTSANSTPRNRSRPKSLFIREKSSPIHSEPTSPKVNFAGQVRNRTAMKPAATEGKGDKKRTLVRSLTGKLLGSPIVEGAIRYCRSPRDSFAGDGHEEERGRDRGDSGRWITAEMVGEGSVLAPINALQLMKQRSA